MASATLSGNISAVVATTAVAIVVLLATSSAAPMSDDPLHQPCTGSSSISTTASLAEIMQSMKENALAIKDSATAMKYFLTVDAQGNPRVSRREVTDLTKFRVNVTGFPHNFKSNPKQNMTEVAITDYIYLSTVYIFLTQSKANVIECDTRADKDTAIARVQDVAAKVQLTLCGVDTFLAVSGNPMPAELIPSQREVMDRSHPSMIELGSDCNSGNIRNKVDYILARDTERTSEELDQQYSELLARLLSQL